MRVVKIVEPSPIEREARRSGVGRRRSECMQVWARRPDRMDGCELACELGCNHLATACHRLSVHQIGSAGESRHPPHEKERASQRIGFGAKEQRFRYPDPGAECRPQDTELVESAEAR